MLLLLLSIGILSSITKTGQAQNTKPYVRIARLVIDSSQITGYRAALEEHAVAAVRNEPGVITLYAVYDKEQPDHVTVFEIYASEDAYRSHITTAHFLKYKSTVKDMVVSLVLTDVVPIALETKPNIQF